MWTSSSWRRRDGDRGVGVRGQQRLDRVLEVEVLVPEADGAAEDAAERQRTVEAARMPLDQPRGDHAAHRLAPRDRPARLAEAVLEAVEQVDLIAEGVLDRPAVRGVGRARQRVAASEQVVGDAAVAPGVGRRVRADRRPVAVAVEEQRAVPGRGHLRLVGRAVGAVPVTQVTAGFVHVGCWAEAGAASAATAAIASPITRTCMAFRPITPPLLARSVRPLSSCLIFGCLRRGRARCYRRAPCANRLASRRGSPTSSGGSTVRCDGRSARSSRPTG